MGLAFMKCGWQNLVVDTYCACQNFPFSDVQPFCDANVMTACPILLCGMRITTITQTWMPIKIYKVFFIRV